ncbi:MULTISPECIES: VOC family protein [unclassified Adlercreutzia]|uniref:VOC family protein n=1 Tax=unclassified Adlercreutzia TaxID=2636013 RepID=UPI0013EC0211|nr:MULTISPECIES: VOC family protein [unclassified Adlercreutzia]
MYERSMNAYGPDQLSYYVEDVEKSAEEFARLFGAGPFIVMEPVVFDTCVYDGKEISLRLKVALGHWSNIQVELVQKLSDEPFLSDEVGFGFNHINVTVPNYDEAVSELEAEGCEIGMYMEVDGMKVAYMRCPSTGHFIEIHEANPSNDATKALAAAWDGQSPFVG